MSTMYNHVAPPNWIGYDCGNFSATFDTPGEHAIVAARSRHRGIVNVCFGDGHVSAIGENVDLTIWRGIGTRNGGETVKGDY
jgi:prepilin-type processing-associated H-X9-DG protein